MKCELVSSDQWNGVIPIFRVEWTDKFTGATVKERVQAQNEAQAKMVAMQKFNSRCHLNRTNPTDI